MTKAEQIDAFKDLRHNIMRITKDPHEAIALDYFDFISWLESKIEGKRFSEVVMRQNMT
jgi:hypothetical protein